MVIDGNTMRHKQIREKALFLYDRALERGDFDTVTVILAQAERDPILAQLITELDEFHAIRLFEPSPNGHISSEISPLEKAATTIAFRVNASSRRTQRGLIPATLLAAMVALVFTSIVLIRSASVAPGAQDQSNPSPTFTTVGQPATPQPLIAPTDLIATLNANTMVLGLNGVWTELLPGSAVRQYIDLPASYDQAQLKALVLQNVSYAFQQGIDFPVTVIIAQRDHPIQLMQFGGPPLPTITPTPAPIPGH